MKSGAGGKCTTTVKKMNTLVKYIFVIIVAIFILIACQNKPPSIEDGGSQYFEKTGYTVQDEFLFFFKKYGGIESLGYPITHEIKVDGWRVQYFENGRLEAHPENEPAYHITVGWLGDLLHRRQPPILAINIPAKNATSQKYYPKTGHTISGGFLNYFNSNGGTVRFGQPISQPFLVNGQLTQDFQSARFYWTSQVKTSVTLENTGQIHLETLKK